MLQPTLYFRANAGIARTSEGVTSAAVSNSTIANGRNRPGMQTSKVTGFGMTMSQCTEHSRVEERPSPPCSATYQARVWLFAHGLLRFRLARSVRAVAGLDDRVLRR